MSYTEQDIRDEAARQYKEILSDADFGSIGERMMGRKPWEPLDEEDWNVAQHDISDAIGHAADLSSWAVEMGAENLVPAGEEVTVRNADGQAVIRLHFGFSADLSEGSQIQVATLLGQYLSETLMG